MISYLASRGRYNCLQKDIRKAMLREAMQSPFNSHSHHFAGSLHNNTELLTVSLIETSSSIRIRRVLHLLHTEKMLLITALIQVLMHRPFMSVLQ